MRPNLISCLQLSWAIKLRPLCALENVMGRVGLKVAKILIVEVFQSVFCPSAAVAAASGMKAHFT